MHQIVYQIYDKKLIKDFCLGPIIVQIYYENKNKNGNTVRRKRLVIHVAEVINHFSSFFLPPGLLLGLGTMTPGGHLCTFFLFTIV